MNRILSSIYDLITIAIVGGGILVFAAEIKLAAAKKAQEGSTKLTGFTQSLTGTTLNLSEERVYGKPQLKGKL
ncbi:MAG: hypothetical protein QF441_16225 [Bacteriovoracaceae bacterium]|jgi:hypothetical protein|nr:hypothetical protein [Halobacteriovoraceae bacterium]MDP7322151.1 hypothetical protein [Bacteriovoracaceae bacterium]|tara:strand:- start:315 stop:533 length:219 start_codon:yes stop_codon:yes gene_type:complete